VWRLKRNKPSFIKELLPYFSSYKRLVALGFVFILCSTALSLALPLFIGDLINDITAIKGGQVVQLLLIVACSLLFESVSTYALAIAGQKVVRDIRTTAWSNVLSFEAGEFDQRNSGELASRIISDSSAIVSFVSNDLPGVIIGVITILGSVAIMFSLDAVMTAVFIVLVPLIIFTIKPISNRVLTLSEKNQELIAKINGLFTETLSHNRLIKCHNAEKQEEKRGANRIDEIYSFSKSVAKIQALLNPIMGAIITLIVVGVVGVGAYRANLGLVSIGALVSFILYFFQIIQPIQSIGTFILEKEAVKGSTVALIQLLKTQGEELNAGQSKFVTDSIVFNNVSFSYNNDDYIIDGVDCVFERGKKTAIVGQSGAGKTTIFSLLERFYTPQKGQILVGNENISNISLSSWRMAFGYVLQDNVVITGTIKENILYGLYREVAVDELNIVLDSSNLRDFVEQQHEGIDYFVGERGCLLSGGQKQRIVIARALLRNPEYLLLDEATANLDSDSEKIVQDALDNLLRDRTSIIIAHRLSSVLSADKIIVLQNGTIAAQGSHNELYSNSAYYRNIVNQQFPDFSQET